MTLDQLREAIPSIWIHNRSPVPPIGERSWLAMFKAAGFLSQVAEVVGKPSRYVTELAETRPTRPLVVWRGASLDSNGRGFSWTQYQECGQGFAQAWEDAYQRASGLYRAEVPGRAVLAIFGDDREQEVVVNPNMFKGRVELVATISTGETDDAAELLPKAETNSLCVDCGIDTASCSGKRGFRHRGRWEHYMIHDDVWAAAGMGTASGAGFLCVGCLEQRLGRQLQPFDFTTTPINELSPWDTLRMEARKNSVP